MPNERTAAEADARLELRLTLVDEAKRRPAQDAAAFLSDYPATNVADALTALGPSFRQDILDALPEPLAHDVLACVPKEAAEQWRRNRDYAPDTLGRFMEPVYAVF